MASANSRSGLFPARGTDENTSNGDIELQVQLPPKQKPNRQQSYENIDGQDFVEDVCHQYEEPVDIRSRNQETERLTSAGEANTSLRENRRNGNVKEATEVDCTDGNRRVALPGVFKILAVAGCFFAILAVILVVLLMTGAVRVGHCGECKSEPVSRQIDSKRSASTQERLWKDIKELKSNVSRLNAALKKREGTIWKLQRQDLKNGGRIAELERKSGYRVFVFNDTTFNISNFLGPQIGVKGDSGLDGQMGKVGSGNLTLCRYMSEESVPFTVGDAAVGIVTVTEQNGYRIIGATCSTMGASEYNLRSEINSLSLRQYECECRGKSKLFVRRDGRAKCIIHYWMCHPYY